MNEIYEEIFCSDSCFEVINNAIMERNDRIISEQMKEWNLPD